MSAPIGYALSLIEDAMYDACGSKDSADYLALDDDLNDDVVSLERVYIVAAREALKDALTPSAAECPCT